MNKLIKRMRNSLKDSGANMGILRRLLLGVVIPVVLLSTTYSSVFFMKGEIWWSAFYGAIMITSGWGLVKIYKCRS